MELLINKTGKYKARDGAVANVTAILSDDSIYPISGNCNGNPRSWKRNGDYYDNNVVDDYDLVEYLDEPVIPTELPRAVPRYTVHEEALRDQIAIAAMAAMIHARVNEPDMDELADTCYDIAEAFIVRRAQ